MGRPRYSRSKVVKDSQALNDNPSGGLDTDVQRQFGNRSDENDAQQHDSPLRAHKEVRNACHRVERESVSGEESFTGADGHGRCLSILNQVSRPSSGRRVLGFSIVLTLCKGSKKAHAGRLTANNTLLEQPPCNGHPRLWGIRWALNVI